MKYPVGSIVKLISENKKGQVINVIRSESASQYGVKWGDGSYNIHPENEVRLASSDLPKVFPCLYG
ncbi:MAG: hypothetical protein ACRC0C_05805 [Gibbsiella quercinecans]|uniref:hypothetical protein n=1 Tax=Gibbsiella quercinecans TaxID=929813 RepID=UPI00338BB6E4